MPTFYTTGPSAAQPRLFYGPLVLRPISLLRITLLRLLDSSFPALWISKLFHPLSSRFCSSQTLWSPESRILVRGLAVPLTSRGLVMNNKLKINIHNQQQYIIHKQYTTHLTNNRQQKCQEVLSATGIESRRRGAMWVRALGWGTIVILSLYDSIIVPSNSNSNMNITSNSSKCQFWRCWTSQHSRWNQIWRAPARNRLFLHMFSIWSVNHLFVISWLP